MLNHLSRRQLLQTGSGFVAATASSALWGHLPALAQLNKQRRKPQQTLYVRGRYLYDSTGQKMILRGVNLPLLDDWGFPKRDTLAELAKTGANAVRIQWYKDYGQPSRPAYSLQDLDRFLAKCKVNRIIPIVFLGDLTCKPDPTMLNSQLIPWWTSQPVLAVLKKHQRYLIINLANELGVYRWSQNPAEALQAYKTAYKTAITSIRQHLHVPIMIDAPDCGTSIEVFTKIGKELINHDPDHNLLLSGHAYWAGYDGMSQLGAVIRANLPIVFGEIANKQFNDGQECYYDLDGMNENHAPIQRNFTYQALLQKLTEQEIGWLAWCWWKDKCPQRQMTQDGNFSGLTPYGNDLVNNPAYGLKARARRSNAFG
ncbi:MAG: cellulase family glycosylhydrolase [Stenomitos frigidus ULC029]